MSKITMEEVNAVYQAIGGLPAIAPALENITWTEMAGGPYGGIYSTAADIIANVFDKLSADWADFEVKPQEFLVTDETIIMFGNYTGVNKKTGKALNARVAHVFKKEGERLQFEQFADTALFFA